MGTRSHRDDIISRAKLKVDLYHRRSVSSLSERLTSREWQLQLQHPIRTAAPDGNSVFVDRIPLIVSVSACFNRETLTSPNGLLAVDWFIGTENMTEI